LSGRVVTGADPKVFAAAGGHDPGRVRGVLDRCLSGMADVKDPREALRAFISPGDVVAIKVNCLAGPGLSSSVTVVEALVARLRDIGVSNSKIIIWERTSRELARAGFTLNRYKSSRPLCLGNDEAGFGPSIEFSGDVGSLFTRVLAERATALINVPVVKDHDLAGVGCAMKNMYGAIHNPNRYHDDNCDPFVADVSNHRFIKDKLRLVVADGLTCQYHGGPARVASHQWRPGQLLVSTDPVALDRIAQARIEEQRTQHGMATLDEARRPPRWLATAGGYGLGEHRLASILDKKV